MIRRGSWLAVTVERFALTPWSLTLGLPPSQDWRPLDEGILTPERANAENCILFWTKRRNVHVGTLELRRRVLRPPRWLQRFSASSLYVRSSYVSHCAAALAAHMVARTWLGMVVLTFRLASIRQASTWGRSSPCRAPRCPLPEEHRMVVQVVRHQP